MKLDGGRTEEYRLSNVSIEGGCLKSESITIPLSSVSFFQVECGTRKKGPAHFMEMLSIGLTLMCAACVLYEMRMVPLDARSFQMNGSAVSCGILALFVALAYGGMMCCACGVVLLEFRFLWAKEAAKTRRLVIVTNSGDRFRLEDIGGGVLKVSDELMDLIRSSTVKTTEINIKTANLRGHSAIFQAYGAREADFRQIVRELQEIKKGLKAGSRERIMVEMLEENSRARDWDAIRATVGSFALQFSSAALANLTGSCLSSLLNL